MNATIIKSNRRTLLLAALAALGIIYSVVVTRFWMVSWAQILPLMKQSSFFRLLFGPAWFGVGLIPITIAVALLRLNPLNAGIAIVLFGVVMNVTQIAFEHWDFGMLVFLIPNLPFDYAMQLPVWVLAWFVAKRILQTPTVS